MIIYGTKSYVTADEAEKFLYANNFSRCEQYGEWPWMSATLLIRARVTPLLTRERYRIEYITTQELKS